MLADAVPPLQASGAFDHAAIMQARSAAGMAQQLVQSLAKPPVLAQKVQTPPIEVAAQPEPVQTAQPVQSPNRVTLPAWPKRVPFGPEVESGGACGKRKAGADMVSAETERAAQVRSPRHAKQSEAEAEAEADAEAECRR